MARRSSLTSAGAGVGSRKNRLAVSSNDAPKGFLQHSSVIVLREKVGVEREGFCHPPTSEQALQHGNTCTFRGECLRIASDSSLEVSDREQPL